MHFHYVHHSKELGFSKIDKLKGKKVECNQSKVTMLIFFKVTIIGLWNWVDWVLKEPEKNTTITQHHTSIYPQTKTEPRLWPSLALSVMLPVVLQLSCLGGASSDWSLLEVFISHFIPLNHLYRNPESFNLSQWWFGSSWDK